MCANRDRSNGGTIRAAVMLTVRDVPVG